MQLWGGCAAVGGARVGKRKESWEGWTVPSPSGCSNPQGVRCWEQPAVFLPSNVPSEPERPPPHPSRYPPAGPEVRPHLSRLCAHAVTLVLKPSAFWVIL